MVVKVFLVLNTEPGRLDEIHATLKEFDEVVFTGDLNKVLGPVKTQFGYHLIEVTSRED